ncbi:MAG: fumarylacetoacetate hydrolase family protein [Proteobacteria bacterium]|nr:fumarylacetoacetate hydrolase family protein [Pseudomonadota bacterium]
MMPDRTVAAARHLIAQRDAVRHYERLPEELRPADLDSAYAVQAEVARQRAAAGRTRGGWKIGCTTLQMQKIMGLPGPAHGVVLADSILTSPAQVGLDFTVAPLAECEIAMRIASDVPARTGGHDAASIARHVGACMAAIELAEARYADRAALTPPELVADDVFQRAIVLGPDVADWQAVDLEGAVGRTVIAGEERGQGHGRDVMGHPLNALAWLADALARAGSGLKAGEVVLTGAIVNAAPIQQGQTAVCSIDGLGEARLTIL